MPRIGALLALLLLALPLLAGCGATSASSDDNPPPVANDDPAPASIEPSTPSIPPPPSLPAGEGGSGSGAGSGSTKPLPTTIPRFVDDAANRIKQAINQRAPIQASRFVSPSGNIFCSIRGNTVLGCEIGDGRMEDPDTCGSAPVSSVGRIEFDHGNPVLICNTDTIRLPNPGVLPYGRVATGGANGLTCLSQKIGVTCMDFASGQGLFLRRGQLLALTAG